MLLIALAAACERAPATAPGESAAARDTTALLGAGRIARLSSDDRAAWLAYVSASAKAAATDSAAMRAELALATVNATVAAPRVDADFTVTSAMTDAWLRSAAGVAYTRALLSYQTPSGGWGKHVDYSAGVRATGQNYNGDANSWEYIGTIDNDATTGQLQYLARAIAATGDTTLRAPFLRGLDWLAAAQMPNGCWPQIWPLQGGYHDAVTFNDDAITHVLTLLRDVGTSSAYAFLSVDARDRAATMLARGLDCVTATQVTVNGARTAWGQQHDPLTLAPTLGRSYELPGISGSESAVLVRFLMSLPAPNAAVVAAVHAAADWFEATRITGRAYDASAGTFTAKAGAGPLWARVAEVGTNRPIFANRDGVKLYDFDLLTDRRTGYTWFGAWPASTLSTYATWSRAHPHP